MEKCSELIWTTIGKLKQKSWHSPLCVWKFYEVIWAMLVAILPGLNIKNLVTDSIEQDRVFRKGSALPTCFFCLAKLTRSRASRMRSQMRASSAVFPSIFNLYSIITLRANIAWKHKMHEGVVKGKQLGIHTALQISFSVRETKIC